jgi:polysaccharide biosynthesis protein
MLTQGAVALVQQAFALGNHGDILVLDMGKPIRILDLARSLIRLSGKREESVKIKFIGLRPGEKCEEELFYPTEELLMTSCEKIKRIQSTPYRWHELQRHIRELRASLSIDGSGPVRVKMKEIVPEYSYEQVPTPAPCSDAQGTKALERAAGQGLRATTLALHGIAGGKLPVPARSGAVWRRLQSKRRLSVLQKLHALRHRKTEDQPG